MYLVNVVKNAIEASGGGGAVTVRIPKSARPCTLIVENTGDPIDPEVANRLFTPFFTTKENGQGIGLTVVQEILSRHGFAFGLESAPDGLTRFTITLHRPPPLIVGWPTCNDLGRRSVVAGFLGLAFKGMEDLPVPGCDDAPSSPGLRRNEGFMPSDAFGSSKWIAATKSPPGFTQRLCASKRLRSRK